MRGSATVLAIIALLAIGVAARAQQTPEPVGAVTGSLPVERMAQTIILPRNVPPSAPASPGSPRAVCGMTLIPADPTIDPRMGTDQSRRPLLPAVPAPPPAPLAPAPSTPPAPPAAPFLPGPGAPAPPVAPPAAPQAPRPPGAVPAPPVAPVPPVPSSPPVPPAPPQVSGAVKPMIRAIQPSICWP